MNISRAIILISFAAASIFPCAHANADDESSFYAILNFGAYYSADRWMPVRFVINNKSAETKDGFCELPLGNPVGSVTIRAAVHVPANASESITAYGYFAEPPGLHSRNSHLPPLAIAQWISNGKREGRAEILGRSAATSLSHGKDQGPSGGAGGGRLALIVTSPDSPAEVSEPPRHRVAPEQAQLLADSQDPTALIDAAEATFPEQFVPTSLPLSSLPRSSVGYDGIAMVVAQGVSPDALDPAQRRALLDYVRGGGVLVLPDPTDEAESTNSWLSPLLPVRLIGLRLAPVLQSGAPALTTTVPLAEAIADDHQPAQIHICLQDSNYVNAAYRDVGLGRVVFTSFPAGALDAKDERTTTLWRQLLGPLDRPHDWSSVPLGTQDSGMLQQLIGHAAAPWTQAAVVAGVYAAIVILMQLLLRGTRRPGAFLATVIVAILGFGGILAANSLRHRNQTLAGARLTTMDIASSGGGLQQESLACLGPDDLNVSIEATPQASVKPQGQNGHSGAGGSPVTIETPSFRIPNMGISSGRIDHVWHAAGPISPGYGISGRGHFDKDGFHLQAKNALGFALHMPLLIYGPSRFPLPEIAPGDSSLAPGPRNLIPEDYSYGSAMQTEVARFRTQMLASTYKSTVGVSARSPNSPVGFIAGWLESIAKPDLIVLNPSADLREQTMVRSAISIDPSTPGEVVHIDAGFNALTAGSYSLPYHFETGKWEAISQTQTWLIAFHPPAEIGTIRTIHATLSADIAAPGHVISIRRGQCVSGHAHANINGPLVAEWDRLTATRSVDIDCSDSDLDANGWLWLRLAVDVPPGEVPRPSVLWKFNSLAMDCDARVIGPPQPPQITWDLPAQIRPSIGLKPPQKKLPSKKPTTKSTTTKPASLVAVP